MVKIKKNHLLFIFQTPNQQLLLAKIVKDLCQVQKQQLMSFQSVNL
jgi:hypothetical protein